MPVPPLLAFIRNLFRKEEAPEPGAVVQELWAAELSGERRGRFVAAKGEGYQARYADEALELDLAKPDLFAWTEAEPYRYSDFMLEGELEFPPPGSGEAAPHSACGFLFRYQDDSNFYSVLVSNRGFYRLDAVFNGKPRALIAWTEVPAAGRDGGAEPEATGSSPSARPGSTGSSLRLIARGSHFTVVVDGLWAGEAVDETFREGRIAFAAQNYGEGRRARFRLESCLLESRPVEVETWYYRWNYYIIPDSAARKALATTFFAMGEHLAAAIQLRKIERRRPLEADELFLKAEVCLRLELLDEAAEALDACLAAEPSRREALEEKANLLYLRGRSLELRDWLASLRREGAVGAALADSARLAGLSGHARFSLGDYPGAAAEYRRAADLGAAGGADEALMRMNEARAWDQAGRKDEAAEAYLKAARLFYAQEADDDLALALGRLSALKPRGAGLKEMKAKVLYRQGRTEEAGKLLAELAHRGSEDSAVHYLLGLVQAGKGERGEALASFERALALEPDYPLYTFRYAESLYLAGRDCRAALARALELGPRDGWTLNLAGQVALAAGELAEARSRLEAARAVLPEAPEPALNLAELESREGRLEAALAVLAPFPESAPCRNQAGNVLSRAASAERSEASAEPAEASAEPAEARRDELLERAAREYEAATGLDPNRPEYQENLAAVYLELDRYSDAEARVRRALDLSQGRDGSGKPSARACLLAGNLASVYGDRPRAEAAYRLGLESSPGDVPLLAALGSSYLSARDFPKARSCVEELRGERPRRAAAPRDRSPGPEAIAAAERLEAAILESSTEAFSCASCGRTWRVPKDLPAQSGASIRAMPPDDSPAGACPACGKVYCIACRKDSLVENRFTCPDCGQALKLGDNRLRYLVREALKRGHP